LLILFQENSQRLLQLLLGSSIASVDLLLLNEFQQFPFQVLFIDYLQSEMTLRGIAYGYGLDAALVLISDYYSAVTP